MISNALSSPILNYCVYNQENRLCTELSIQLHEEETGSAGTDSSGMLSRGEWDRTAK